ncbi:MAG: hypothetical protein LIP09_14775 [Bacteroidales bacterium]|nr:hypothetical protein [Bacteroidales bacterium]
MDMFTIIATLKGYFGGSFTEEEARKHLKKAHLDADTINQAIEEARKEGLITSK